LTCSNYYNYFLGSNFDQLNEHQKEEPRSFVKVPANHSTSTFIWFWASVIPIEEDRKWQHDKYWHTEMSICVFCIVINPFHYLLCWIGCWKIPAFSKSYARNTIGRGSDCHDSKVNDNIWNVIRVLPWSSATRKSTTTFLQGMISVSFCVMHSYTLIL